MRGSNRDPEGVLYHICDCDRYDRNTPEGVLYHICDCDRYDNNTPSESEAASLEYEDIDGEESPAQRSSNSSYSDFYVATTWEIRIKAKGRPDLLEYRTCRNYSGWMLVLLVIVELVIVVLLCYVVFVAERHRRGEK